MIAPGAVSCRQTHPGVSSGHVAKYPVSVAFHHIDSTGDPAQACKKAIRSPIFLLAMGSLAAYFIMFGPGMVVIAPVVSA